jgi:hypothetical protein
VIRVWRLSIPIRGIRVIRGRFQKFPETFSLQSGEEKENRQK